MGVSAAPAVVQNGLLLARARQKRVGRLCVCECVCGKSGSGPPQRLQSNGAARAHHAGKRSKGARRGGSIATAYYLAPGRLDPVGALSLSLLCLEELALGRARLGLGRARLLRLRLRAAVALDVGLVAGADVGRVLILIVLIGDGDGDRGSRCCGVSECAPPAAVARRGLDGRAAGLRRWWRRRAQPATIRQRAS